MSLAKILQALEAEAAQEIAEIERAADAEVARIRAEAQDKAAAARHKHAPALAAPLHAERARILNQAKLEALRTVMGTREELMRAAVAAAADHLATLPEDEAYALALESMTCEAVAALGQNPGLLLRVESCDRPIMERIVERLRLQATIEEGATAGDGAAGDDALGGRCDCPGGVVVTTADGRVTLDNTLGVRLQRVSALYRSVIAAMLFDESV
jgi:V/A-type H+/Na+-transporting ATPase subunit E